MERRRPYPEIVVLVASAAWGLFWIPLRAFEQHGLGPAWATLAQFLTPLAIMTPFAVARLLQGRPTGFSQYRSGLLIGGAVALYLSSLLLTDVARALILFYAMPAWGTLLEVVVMRRRFTRWRGISLLLSLSGMLVILSAGHGLSLSMNLGDLLALLSGVLFAVGAMLVRQAPETSVFEQLVGFFLYGSVVALTFSLLPLAGARPTPFVRPGDRSRTVAGARRGRLPHPRDVGRLLGVAQRRPGPAGHPAPDRGRGGDHERGPARRRAVRRAAGHRGRPRDRRRRGGGRRKQTGGADRGGAVILPLSCV